MVYVASGPLQMRFIVIEHLISVAFLVKILAGSHSEGEYS